MDAATRQIIIQCQQGNKQAFKALCEAHYDFCYRVALRMLGDQEEARDVVQEGLIRVWNNLSGYRSDTKFTTWLYTIITRLCIDSLRKHKEFHSLETEEATLTEDPLDLSAQLTLTELVSIVRSLAAELSPKQQSIFVLRDLEGLEIKEITGITGMTADSVKSNLCHARKTIRQWLKTRYNIMSFKSI